MKYTVSFTAWYLNPDRICQLINSRQLAKHLSSLNGVSGTTSALSEAGVARAIIKDALEEWLHSNQIPSLGELILKNRDIKPGTLFTIYQDFYGKGLAKYNDCADRLPMDAIAELHNKLSFCEDKRIRIKYSPRNLISSSSWERLGGHTRLFGFCYVEEVSDNEIIARPYMIGDIHTGLELETPESWHGQNYGEIHVGQIDQFAKIQEIYDLRGPAPDLDVLKGIPEEATKLAIAEMVSEGNIPRDWGGEKSDLFTTNISIEGTHLPAAFLFKGPAKFSEMKMVHLGKNGDQIDRLFSEPASLLILQHCHKVSTAVRSTMKAFASRIHDLRYFTIIDGYDTIRLLQAYRKCGLSP